MDYCLILGDVRWLSTVGLIMDIVGVVVLTSAVLLSRKTISDLAGTYWDENPHLKGALRRQTRCGWFGLALLVPGFLLQIAGTWCA